MAQIEVKVPQLSESVAEATLLSWHKKVGEAVARDENLIDIETDKVVLELPAPSAGVIVQIIKNDGGTVVSGETIAIIRVEQLYPFPHKAFAAELKKYPNVSDVVWAQDEPQNQGPWFQIQHNVF